ncbi:hypothetical protein [Azospirillum canadense]|nr:hypothetical protein [Azospirillum canadense]MCW2236199.1 hypothetical protein [Azospirillum canadense]
MQLTGGEAPGNIGDIHGGASFVEAIGARRLRIEQPNFMIICAYREQI